MVTLNPGDTGPETQGVLPDETAQEHRAPVEPVQQRFDARAIDGEYEGLLDLIESRLNLADISPALDEALQQFTTDLSNPDIDPDTAYIHISRAISDALVTDPRVTNP